MYRDTIGASFLLQWLLLQGVFLLRPLLGLDNATWSLPVVVVDFKFATQEQRDEASAFYTMPVLEITGADDGCIDTRLFDRTMATANRDATYRAGCALLRVENAGAGHLCVHRGARIRGGDLGVALRCRERQRPPLPSAGRGRTKRTHAFSTCVA